VLQVRNDGRGGCVSKCFVVAVEEGETQIKGSDMLCYVMSCYVGGVDQKKQNNLGAKTAHIFDTKKSLP